MVNLILSEIIPGSGTGRPDYSNDISRNAPQSYPTGMFAQVNLNFNNTVNSMTEATITPSSVVGTGKRWIIRRIIASIGTNDKIRIKCYSTSSGFNFATRYGYNFIEIYIPDGWPIDAGGTVEIKFSNYGGAAADVWWSFSGVEETVS